MLSKPTPLGPRRFANTFTLTIVMRIFTNCAEPMTSIDLIKLRESDKKIAFFSNHLSIYLVRYSKTGLVPGDIFHLTFFDEGALLSCHRRRCYRSRHLEDVVLQLPIYGRRFEAFWHEARKACHCSGRKAAQRVRFIHGFRFEYVFRGVNPRKSKHRFKVRLWCF